MFIFSHETSTFLPMSKWISSNNLTLKVKIQWKNSFDYALHFINPTDLFTDLWQCQRAFILISFLNSITQLNHQVKNHIYGTPEKEIKHTQHIHIHTPTDKMRSIAVSIILLGYIVTMSKCEQAYETNALDFEGLATDIDKNSFLKRMERRAYTYMTGVPGSKRLPNYNFGLGKRAR